MVLGLLQLALVLRPVPGRLGRIDRAIRLQRRAAGRRAPTRPGGHIGIALTNALRGSNPFSEACLVAMDYGRESIVKEDWKKIFREDELDRVIARMLKLEATER